jgi:hypothetical protein
MLVTSKHGKKMVPLSELKFFVNCGLSNPFLRANVPNAHMMNNFATARNAARNISRNKGCDDEEEEEEEAIFFVKAF